MGFWLHFSRLPGREFYPYNYFNLAVALFEYSTWNYKAIMECRIPVLVVSDGFPKYHTPYYDIQCPNGRDEAREPQKRFVRVTFVRAPV
jgi:hypothetical protein